MVEHASLGEVPERRVGAQGGDVAHVDDAVGDEGHGAVERRQGEQHERGLRGASSSAARRGSTPPWRGVHHRRRRGWIGRSVRRVSLGGRRESSCRPLCVGGYGCGEYGLGVVFDLGVASGGGGGGGGLVLELVAARFSFVFCFRSSRGVLFWTGEMAGRLRRKGLVRCMNVPRQRTVSEISARYGLLIKLCYRSTNKTEFVIIIENHKRLNLGIV